VLAVEYAASVLSTHSSARFAGLVAFVVAANVPGGQMIAKDRESGTLPFLLRQPVGKRLIWGARLAADALAWVMVLLSYGLAVYLWPGERAAVYGRVTLESWRLIGFYFGLSGFAAGLLASAVLDRTLVAILAGMCLTVVVALLLDFTSICLPVGMPADYLDYRAGQLSFFDRGYPHLIRLLPVCLVMVAVILAISYLLFARREE